MKFRVVRPGLVEEAHLTYGAAVPYFFEGVPIEVWRMEPVFVSCVIHICSRAESRKLDSLSSVSALAGEFRPTPQAVFLLEKGAREGGFTAPKP